MIAAKQRHALTVDVEDYFHVSAFASVVRPESWAQQESRVEANTGRVLELFAAHGVRATFFVLGWVAERYPQLVWRIRHAGHEIGCHSFAHRLIYDMTPEQFRQDTRRAKDALEQTTGETVSGYRAPSFSVTRKSLWALEILAEEGFQYDCSIAPVHHDLYGFPAAPPYPHWQETHSGRLAEFPISTIRLGGWRVPVAGGGYLRLFPLQATIWAMKQIRARTGQPLMVYFHPWELDADQPRLAASLRSRVRHYVGLQSTRRKLEALLNQFEFAPVSDVLAETLGFVPSNALRKVAT